MEIGIVGKPNVGKSTFFKALTLSDVEIKNFPFTTIDANIGVGYVRTKCPCKSLNLKCNPQNSLCISENRFIPVKLIDVAGLVPGAHEGKGLGNKFLDDLRRADALIHVVDISGKTNEKGEPAQGCDPENDIKFLVQEIDAWFFTILKKNWDKVKRKIKYEGKNPIYELADVLSGLGITEGQIRDALGGFNLENKLELSPGELRELAITLRKKTKPIIISGNKIDQDRENYFAKLKGEHTLIPTCAEAELALREAQSKELIDYLPGDPSFKIVGKVDEKQEQALKFIQKKILNKWGSTGVQKCLNTAVFDILKRIVVYPVENENKLTDKKGNVLPDAYLLPEGSTPLDLAYRVHSDIGDKFIGAIDCRTKQKIGKDHKLEDGDIIKILTSR